LPSNRVSNEPPFSNLGLDYYGPISLRRSHTPEGREVVKCYGALFTCLSVRAVSLELAIDGTARTFLLALRRHIARHGVPVTIVSDSGTNLLLGRRTVELVESGRKKKEDVILSFCASRSINWRVNTPLAPWRGGVFERMVALTRESLQAMVTRSRPAIDVYETLLVEAATIINSRPITYLAEGVAEPLPLRPLDFLRPFVNDRTIGGIGEFHPVHGVPTKAEDLKHMWSGLNERLDRFWRTWSGEYLTGLLDRRTKRPALGFDRPPEVGEVVLVNDDKLIPRAQWPVARIVELVPSKDNEIRTVVIRMGNTQRLVKRPIERLHPLELSPGGGQASVQRGSTHFVLTTLTALMILALGSPTVAGTSSPFQPWGVVGTRLGQAFFPAPHQHVSIYVDLNFSEDLERLGASEELSARWKEALCHVLPEAWEDCNTGSRRRRRFIGELLGGGALLLGLRNCYKIGKLEDKLDAMGPIHNETLGLIREQAIWNALRALAQDWASVSLSGEATVRFWTDETKKLIIDELELDPDCYLRDRVFEAVSTLRIVEGREASRYPHLRVEIRLLRLRDCGQLAVGISDIGEFVHQRHKDYFARKVIPSRGVFRGEQFREVRPGHCQLVRLNTYECQESDYPWKMFQNGSCLGKVEQSDRPAYTTIEHGCLKAWEDTELADPCFVNTIVDNDRGEIYVATTCPSYSIESERHSLEGPTQLVVQLARNQSLEVGGNTIQVKGLIKGKRERVELLHSYNRTRLDRAEEEVKNWAEGSRSEGMSTPGEWSTTLISLLGATGGLGVLGIILYALCRQRLLQAGLSVLSCCWNCATPTPDGPTIQYHVQAPTTSDQPSQGRVWHLYDGSTSASPVTTPVRRPATRPSLFASPTREELLTA
jgi:hypothetical protein